MIVPLSDIQLEAIQNSCPKSQAEIDQTLAIIKHWLKKQPHLPSTSDEMLKKFMFSLKYRIEKIKLVVDNYYTVRETYPQMYENLDPTTESFQKDVEAVYMFPLPKLTEDLNRALCFKMRTSDAKSFFPDNQLKRNELIWNWLFNQDALTFGNIWIFDLSDLNSLALLAYFNMSFMKKVLKTSMDAKPVRIKKVHFINISIIAEATLNLVKNFFPQKYRDRIVFHSTSETLQDYCSLDILPCEWGGKAGTIEELNQKMHEQLIKSRNWCIEMESLKADSSKRIGQSKNADESILGVEGNFKKLDLD